MKIFQDQSPQKNFARPDGDQTRQPPDHKSDMHPTESQRLAEREVGWGGISVTAEIQST